MFDVKIAWRLFYVSLHGYYDLTAYVIIPKPTATTKTATNTTKQEPPKNDLKKIVFNGFLF
jgi:hypothetical protein